MPVKNLKIDLCLAVMWTNLVASTLTDGEAYIVFITDCVCKNKRWQLWWWWRPLFSFTCV